MTIEFPVFRLGLVGFSQDQQQDIVKAVPAAGAGALSWEKSSLETADAWLINSARARWLGGARLRVGPGTPSARALVLDLPDVGRPVAFSQPVSSPDFQPAHSFDPTSPASMQAVIEEFGALLAPVRAQFCLAARIVEHEGALRPGVFELTLEDRLLAVVDMQGDTAVRSAAAPGDFSRAAWRRRADPQRAVPGGFERAGLAQLMWQYAMRTRRDVLPRRYRTRALYFRRAPRLPPKLLMDAHLLLMRELAGGPATFEALQRRCRLDEAALAHALAALYLVGTITSNPERAANPPRILPRRIEPEAASAVHSGLPSMLDSVAPREATAADAARDLTAPAFLAPRWD